MPHTHHSTMLSRLSWLALFFFFFFVCCTTSRCHGVNLEGQLLLRFKALIHVDPLGLLNNWNASDADPCHWSGVVCDNVSAAVITLSLPRAQLQGSLAPDIGGLSHLRHLNLHHNHLFGPIPTALFNATQLESLFLFSNNLSGPLPPLISSLSALQSLDLSHNALSGTITESLANCTRLFSITLSHNSFSGSIPSTLGGSLLSLRRLDLSHNSVTGAIPETLGDLPALIGTLDLSHNHLSGTIPESLASLPANVTMDLSYNNFAGAIPRDGAFAKQGAAAFLGNPGLCGIPLSKLCYVAPPPLHAALRSRSRGLSKGAIVAIAVGDAAGVALVCLVFLYCYWRAFSQKKSSGKGGLSSSTPSSADPGGHRPSWLCAKTTTTEMMPEAFDQGELVALDDKVTFDLDELLKASAYVLGKSGEGIVYKVILSDDLVVAVRRLGDQGANRFKEFQAEVEAIGRLRHPNIVSLRAYYWAPDEKLLVYDYIPNGSLTSVLSGPSSQPVGWASRLKIAKGAARGLTYLHDQGPSRRFAHGSIKPSNILLDSEMEPYIADYGLKRLLSIVGSGVPSGQVGKVSVSSRSSTGSVMSNGGPVSPEDLHYQAPEAALSKSNKPTQKGDVYSLGMVLLQLLTGKLQVLSPASEVELSQWIEAALQGKEPLLRIVDPVLVDEMHRADDMLTLLKLALACVSPQPDHRPTMRLLYESLSRIGTPLSSS